MLKKTLIPFLFFVSPIFGQLPSKIIEAISIPNETIAIQGIKSNYLAGENISISLNVTEIQTQKATQLSVPVYVELIDLEAGKLLRRFILKIENGNAKLEYRFPLTLKTANYQIRAYTNWMRNFSESNFAKINFPVFGQNYKEEMRQSSLQSVLDTVMIFPEGNNLIADLKNKIVVRASDNFGRPFETNFSIKNQNNETIIEAKTGTNGLSFLEFLPKHEDKYSLVSSNRIFKIENIRPTGTTLTIDNLSNKEKVRVIIQNSVNAISKDSLYFVIVHLGEVAFFSNFENRQPLLLLPIERKKLPVGVLNTYLCKKNGEIVSSRIFENKHNERPNLDLNLELIQTLPESFIATSNKFYPEKGLSIKGRLRKVSGKDLRKEENFTLMLSDVNSDTTTNKPESIFAKAKDNFKITDLEFYGRKQATFICPYAIVEIDTTIEIPSILKENNPVNWKLVSSELEMERRKEEVKNAILEENRKNSIQLQEVVIKAKKIEDPFNKFEGLKPNTVMKFSEAQGFQQMGNLLSYISKYKCIGMSIVKLIIDGHIEVPEGDNVNDIILGNVEKVEVYKDTEAAIFNCNCAINVVLYGPRSFFKENKTAIIEGFYVSKP